MLNKALLATAAVTALALAGCAEKKMMADGPATVSNAAPANEPVSGDPNVPVAEIPGQPTGGNIPDPGISTAAAPNEPVSGDPNSIGATPATSYVIEDAPETTASPYVIESSASASASEASGATDGGVSTAAAPNEPVSGDPNTVELTPATSYVIEDAPELTASPYVVESSASASAPEASGATDGGVSTAAAPNEPVSGTASGAGETASNPAADACYEKGGNVIQWYDADGKGIDACRTSEGAEYSLTDYATYGG